MKLARTWTSAIITDRTVRTLVDFIFGIIIKTLSSASYYAGAYCCLTITPGALVSSSPLLARTSDTGYNFPGHPVSLRFLNIQIRNVTKWSSHGGQWGAVFVPYRELHDEGKYVEQLKSTSFSELSQMPHARVRPASMDINIRFPMKDKTLYCARPRELDEGIGVLLVIWDSAQTPTNEKPTSADFTCEVTLEAGVQHHTVFGPTHRQNFEPSVFALKQHTSEVQVHHKGNVSHYSLEEWKMLNDFENLSQSDASTSK